MKMFKYGGMGYGKSNQFHGPKIAMESHVFQNTNKNIFSHP